MQNEKSTAYPPVPHQNQTIFPRQIAFAAAFLLPVGKFLETPSILSRAAKGDILLPAVLRFLTETLVLLAVLYAATRSEKTLVERINATLGGWSAFVYVPFAFYYLFAALLPVLDLEKFVYAAFFDTAPTTFYFAAFFLLSAFFAAKNVQAVGRVSDFCLFLFLLPFIAVIVMSFTETDFSHLLPFFSAKFPAVLRGVRDTTPHFSDVALLLPMLANCQFRPLNERKRERQKGDRLVLLGYFVGAFFTLLFFAVFYSIFSSIAPREHYAFSKIAQYFPALEIVGRMDLLFVYLLTVVLFFYTCLPIHYATGCLANTLRVQRRTFISAALSILLFLFALFCNRFYNIFYQTISHRLAPIFWIFADAIPLFLLLLPKDAAANPTKTPRKENANA